MSKLNGPVHNHLSAMLRVLRVRNLTTLFCQGGPVKTTEVLSSWLEIEDATHATNTFTMADGTKVVVTITVVEPTKE